MSFQYQKRTFAGEITFTNVKQREDGIVINSKREFQVRVGSNLFME